jgi:RimJ/RimL family protein N-acetyltransferase
MPSLLTLRPATLQDAHTLFGLCWSNPAVMQYQAFRQQKSPDEAVSRLESFLDGWQTGEDFYWVIALKPAPTHQEGATIELNGPACQAALTQSSPPKPYAHFVSTLSKTPALFSAGSHCSTGHSHGFGSGVLYAPVDGDEPAVLAPSRPVLAFSAEKIVGCLMLSQRGEANYTLGYSIGQAFWGRGYATQAVKLSSRWAFETVRAHTLHAYCFRGNVASCRVLKKAGFEYKKTLFNSHPLPNLEPWVERVMLYYTLTAQKLKRVLESEERR